MSKWVHILRIRAEHFEQRDMFSEEREPRDVISDAILAMPEGEIGGGSDWHIAAAEKFGESAVFFQIGRIQRVNESQYSDTERKFYDAEVERGPYTTGVFDLETQTCALERKAPIAMKASEIAPKLEKLLNLARVTSGAGYAIHVDELRDPAGFIQQIQDAYSVTRFSFTAGFENAPDVFGLIHKPAEAYNDAIGGNGTKVETTADELDKEVVEEVARSVASVGDPASASVKDEKGSRPRVIHLRGIPLLEQLEITEKAKELKSAMLAAAKRGYRRIRAKNNDS